MSFPLSTDSKIFAKNMLAMRNSHSVILNDSSSRNNTSFGLGMRIFYVRKALSIE